MPEIRALWDEAFIFRALPHIFRAKSIQPILQKMARTPMTISIYLVWLQELKLIIVGVLLLNYHLAVALTSLFPVYTCLFIGSLDNKLEYEDTVGCLQSIIDSNLNCNFVFGGDWNVNKLQQNAFLAIEKFCDANGIL